MNIVTYLSSVQSFGNVFVARQLFSIFPEVEGSRVDGGDCTATQLLCQFLKLRVGRGGEAGGRERGRERWSQGRFWDQASWQTRKGS